MDLLGFFCWSGVAGVAGVGGGFKNNNNYYYYFMHGQQTIQVIQVPC